MFLKSLLTSLLIVFSIKIAACQNTYDIDFSGKDRKRKCETCIKAFKNQPAEAKFSIKRENENLYFEINDKNWFNDLFQNDGDGLAIDIVLKDRYSCELETVKNTQIKGLLLEPVYSEALKKGLKQVENNVYSTWVGKIPEGFRDREMEWNILFIGNKNLCQYNVLFDLDTYTSDLLDMGMYLDSLTYDTRKIKTTDNENYITRNKTLKFIIPFQKNKSKYSQEDIKPIYDSLRLTGFNIKTINIKAYSSIEGITHRNLELQELRAKNIVSALQSFQKPTIETNVSTSENWVEFFNDIKGTKYENLSLLSKNEVKSKIAGSLSREMEPIFRKHRKAILELQLEKKDKYRSEDAEALLKKFNVAVASNKIDEALDFQNSIFEKLKSGEIPLDFLRGMSVPKDPEFIKLLNKNSAIKYVLDFRQALIVYNEMLALEKLAPNDNEVKYNLVALKIKLWSLKAIDVKDSDLLNEINGLKKYGIHKALISRMLVNYHMVTADNLMVDGDFETKDASVEFINRNYKKTTLSDYDYLSLAQSFSYYGHSNLAVELLERKARSIDIDEDLLFYYLNLTLVDKELTKDPNYRTIMLNAVNMNSQRFCKLFNSIDNGGITFQLLDDPYLRKTYCENCKD
ncbi:hypothetical protein WJN01_04730 [Flavobacteriaceae bacterium SZ-1-7]|uniref:hypothetical protein n=1 Tax=Tamlana sedimenti TaxID=3134126 RepID=UPI003128C63E